MDARRCARRLRQAVYSVSRFLHTPLRTNWASAATILGLLTSPLAAQSAPAATLLDALSITVQQDSQSVARGSLRFRQLRTGADLELVATGIVVRRGLRVTAELRTDTAFVFRRYTAESRDSSGIVVDRIQVRSAGGRITMERTTPARRTVREFLAQRNLMIVDSAAVVPFVVLAGLGARVKSTAVLDVRSATLVSVQLSFGSPIDLLVADVMMPGTLVTMTGLPLPVCWWRDARGRLLRVAWGVSSRVIRDDPPA